jgi:ribose transport system substrate-binding protein
MRKIFIVGSTLLLAAFGILLFYIIKKEVFVSNDRTSKDQSKTIAISTIGATHGWPVGVLYHAEEEVQRVAEENNWQYICLVAKDSNEQSRQLVDLINQKVDCIVMLPMDGASLKTAAKSVQDAGIPLVIFDREIPDFAPTATVKGDNAGIGITTAKIFNAIFPEGTKVLEFMGDTSTVPQQRTDGYDETINDNFTKEQVGYTGWQRSAGRELFQDWVEKHSQEQIDEVGAIFTHDDEIALGILDALDAYKVDENFKKTFKNLKVISGSAGPQEMYHRILKEDKYYLFSLTYRGAMIRDAIRIGEKIIKGENYNEMLILSTYEVNKSNAKEYLDADSPY